MRRVMKTLLQISRNMVSATGCNCCGLSCIGVDIRETNHRWLMRSSVQQHRSTLGYGIPNSASPSPYSRGWFQQAVVSSTSEYPTILSLVLKK